jgi:hypothetical protein
MADKAGTMYKDFYGVFEETNWLHSITKLPEDPSDRGVPTTIQYFENMSEAMARTCVCPPETTLKRGSLT